MSLSDLASVGSLVSGLAVLVSLVLLYFQLRQLNQQVRQSERNQQASIRHSRVTRTVDMHLARANPGVTDAWRRGLQHPDEITQTELTQFLSLCRAQFDHVEDAFYQHAEGLLNEDAFAAVLGSVRGLFRYPSVREAWQRVRQNQAGRFRDFMDDAVASARLEPPNRFPSVDEWRANCAAEAAGA